MNKQIFNKVVQAHREFRELFNDPNAGLLGFQDDSIQLRKDVFDKFVEEYKIENVKDDPTIEKIYPNWRRRYFEISNGVRVLTCWNTEEIVETQKDEDTDGTEDTIPF